MDSTPLFRKKVIDKLASPEELTDYIRVGSPSVWVTLSAILILLICFFVWCVYGRVEVNTTDHSGHTESQLIRPIDYFF